MNLPNDINLPFFAYGLFKPGQLCHYRIKELVRDASEVEVSGYLKERDGIPLLILSNYSVVRGVLLQFIQGKEAEAYSRITEIEPDEVYRWGKVSVANNTMANANVLVGRRPDRGSSDLEHFEEWDGRDDPFFKYALEEVESLLKQNSQFLDFKNLFRLQMAYTLLWTAIERYAGLKYHLGKAVAEKVYQIATEKAFADSLRKNVTTKRIVYSTADLGKYTLDPDNPDKSIRYYYQVRSNTVHRGKAVIRDFNLLKSSLEELLEIFRDVLMNSFDIK